MSHRVWRNTVLMIVASVSLCASLAQAQSPSSRQAKRYQQHIERLAQCSTQKLLDIIAKTAPTIRDAIESDRTLREEVGERNYRTALAQVALLTRSKDRECREALRIIGDTVPRTKAPVGNIRLDGLPGEWGDILPTPRSRRWPEQTKDRAREVWQHGVAALVRTGRLYLMAGVENPGYFDQPHNRLRVKIDCVGGPEWDVCLFIQYKNGAWVGWCDFLARGGEPKRASVPLKGIEGAIKQVAEIAVYIEDFAPAGVAKPIWTVYFNARTVTGDKTYHPRTKTLPIFNESAPPGVAATPYVRNLMLLAADVGLQESDRTAAAIAITSATAFASSNDEVRRQLRRDNANLLRLARDTVAWQRRQDTDYRLDRYPLEAQLAWANRCNWLGVTYLSWNRSREERNDLDNYRWAFISVETLSELHELARTENLIAKSAGNTAHRVDKWVTSKLIRRPWVHHLPKAMERCKNDPKKVAKLRQRYEDLLRLRESGAVTVGRFKDEPVYQVFARNTTAYLRLIRERGHFYGGCPDEAWIGQDLLRSVGLAPLEMGVSPSRGNQVGHCWASYFDLKSSNWKSAQAGRRGSVWWLFNLDRIAVYPSAAMAPGIRENRELPFPLFYRRELQGKEIKSQTQNGIPTPHIRRWMLTPCW